jgi:hypothetical protein
MGVVMEPTPGVPNIIARSRRVRRLITCYASARPSKNNIGSCDSDLSGSLRQLTFKSTIAIRP